jgi:uncharacterized protein YbaR (Trm112 family)
MLAPILLSRLVCPVTHQDVVMATTDELAAINASIAKGETRNVAGRTLRRPLEEALIRSDRKVAYEIRGKIPIMLPQEGISLEARS